MDDNPTYEELRQKVEALERADFERRQAERNLACPGKRSLAWLEHSPMCTKIVDLGYNLQYMSRAGISGLGIEDITEYYGKPYPFEFYPESFRTRMIASLDRVVEEGEIVTQEAPVVDLNGNELWFHSTLVPVNDDEGRIDSIIILSADTTEKNLAEAALEESPALLSQGAAMAKRGWWEWDRSNDRMISCSEQLARLYEMSVDEAIAFFSSMEDEIAVVHPDDQERYEKHRLESRDRKEGMDIEYRIITPSGAVRHVYLKEELVVDAQGRVTRSFGLEQDITDRKEAEAELIRDQFEKTEFDARFERAMDASGGYIYDSDKDGRFTYLSDRFEEISGHRSGDLIGKRLTDIVPASSRSEVRSALENVTKSPLVNHEFEVPVVHREGHITWLNVTRAPYYDLGGEFVGYCGSGTDITLRKERDIELAYSRQEADNANQAKSEFLASMSHEIRTPMNGVLGMTDLLLMSDLPDDVRDKVEIIKESGGTLLSLLNDILDLSKIEVGKIEIELTEVDVVSLLGSVASLVDGQVRKKGLWCRQEAGDELVFRWIMADPTRIRQVLTNLISNAIKFTHEGGITLRLTQNERHDGRVETRFVVSDTGIGVSEQQHDRIFEAFAQADETTTRNYGGTGLGLSISKQLVELMGGRIGLTSQPTKGSSFWFTIVSDKSIGEQVAVCELPGSVARTDREAPARVSRLLVAEDNAVNQLIISEMLEALGFEYEVVNNGREAVDSVSDGGFDLILMDINMPVLGGVDATARIRDLPGDIGKLPIIALTANAMRGDRESYLAAGMDDHIPKPINPGQLLQVIARHTGSTWGELISEPGEAPVSQAKC